MGNHRHEQSDARYERSKEKRNDCPLIVLALVVNVEGFIKYSAIYQGNMSDSRSLPDMIDRLRVATSGQTRALVVMDAGIATEDTQKVVTTTAMNDKEQYISIRKCSEPTDKVKFIYDALGYKYAPFIRKKSVVPKSEIIKKTQFETQIDTG